MANENGEKTCILLMSRNNVVLTILTMIILTIVTILYYLLPF